MKRKMDSLMLPAAILCSDEANLQLPSPDLVQYYRDNSRRVYWLEGEIMGDDNLFIKRLIDWNQEDAGIPREERTPVYLMIDTPGGDLYTTLALIDAIMASETPVIGVVVGTAYSGGFYVLLACDKRIGMRHSSYMMHRGSGTIDAPDQMAAEMAMKQWSEQVKTFMDFVVERTSMQVREVRKALNTDTYYSADKALEKGILTGMVTSMNELTDGMAALR